MMITISSVILDILDRVGMHLVVHHVLRFARRLRKWLFWPNAFPNTPNRLNILSYSLLTARERRLVGWLVNMGWLVHRLRLGRPLPLAILQPCLLLQHRMPHGCRLGRAVVQHHRSVRRLGASFHVIPHC